MITETSPEHPDAVLILPAGPEGDNWNQLLATFLAHCTMNDLCVHSEVVDGRMKAIAW